MHWPLCEDRGCEPSQDHVRQDVGRASRGVAVYNKAAAERRISVVFSSFFGPIVRTGKRLRIEPFAYLRDMFTRISTHP